MLCIQAVFVFEELTTLTVNNVSDGVVKVLGKGNKWREVQDFPLRYEHTNAIYPEE